VIADNCTDSTATKAVEAGARVLVRQNETLRGKGYALRFAFDTLMQEGFDGFLIVDADSIVSDNLVPAIVRHLSAGADAVQTRYRVTQPLDSERKRLMDVALLAFNVLRPKGRSGWGLSAGILGNGFALSRKTLLEVPYSADSIVEDLEYHLLLVDARRKVDFVDAATVYGDMPNDSGAQVSQRARWEGGRARMAVAWVPKLAARLLTGKLCVLEPLLELLTLPLAYLAVVALLLCALPIGAFEIYGAALILLIVAHVLVAVTLGGNASESLAALATAPGYVFWKLTRMGAIIRSSRPDTQWLRTPRASDVKPEVPDVR
jgi:cellulose synthase/poly-beta-1,6-N-acetylglucosamine synthase-like glycosyltransferase